MFALDPSAFEPPVSTLLAAEPEIVLGPGRRDESKTNLLSSLEPQVVTAPRHLADRNMAQCCISGLWLNYNFLDESHVISQEIKTAEGSYWHGIMHRREPDYSNAKYWFRQVGDHEIFPQLCDGARELAEAQPHDAAAGFLANQTHWDPFQFIDLCEMVERGRASSETLCRQIAQLEWRLLFDFCARKAAGE